MEWYRIIAPIIACGVLVSPSNAAAESIQDTLHNSLGPIAGPVADVANSAINTNLSIPAPANSLAFEFDEETGLPKRIQGSLGPVFTERATTIGRKKFALDAALLAFKFNEIDGIDLTNGELSIPVVTPLGPGNAQVLADVHSYILILGATYGASDNLDLNFGLPIVRNEVDLTVMTQVGPKKVVNKSTNDSTNLGDIIFRGKYRFYDRAPYELSTAVTINVPTGDADNFAGTDLWRIRPFLMASAKGRRLNAHANIGFDLGDTSDAKNDFRYRLGLDWSFNEWGGMSAEALGRYIIDNDRRKLDGGKANDHLADAAVGLKFQLWKDAVLSTSALFALNDTGLRDRVTGTLGFEMNF